VNAISRVSATRLELIVAVLKRWPVLLHRCTVAPLASDLSFRYCHSSVLTHGLFAIIALEKTYTRLYPGGFFSTSNVLRGAAPRSEYIDVIRAAVDVRGLLRRVCRGCCSFMFFSCLPQMHAHKQPLPFCRYLRSLSSLPPPVPSLAWIGSTWSCLLTVFYVLSPHAGQTFLQAFQVLFSD